MSSTPERPASASPGPESQSPPEDSATPAAGRDRLGAAVRRPTRRQVSVAVLLAVLGFAAVTQVQSTESDDTYSGLRQEDLVQVLNGLQSAAQRAENDIDQLEQAQAGLLSNADSREAAIARAREQADALGVLAGTLPATGPGIRVIVTDESGQIGIDQLLNAIQELRDAGAEAIELNDAVRVVAQTALDDGGAAGEPGRVVVDGQELSQPYVIDAIGDPDTLATALEILGGFVEQVDLANGRAVIKRPDVVEIASVRDLRAPEYATAVEDE